MTTTKVSLDEILGLDRYERVRDELRRRIIGLKKHRRVAVGDRVTLVFENHETMLFQIQEMIRAERIVDLDKIREEIEVYNELIPNDEELSATLLIEITESERIREELVQLIGIDETVSLQIDEAFEIPAKFEPGRSKEDKLSAVQYIRFRFSPAERDSFLDAGKSARICIRHPNYSHTAEIPGPVRASLIEDLRPR
jgi:hypothetical protein